MHPQFRLGRTLHWIYTWTFVILTWKSVYEEHADAIDTLAWLIKLSSVVRLEQVLVAVDAFLSARILRVVLCLLCGGRMGVCLHTTWRHTKTIHTVHTQNWIIDWRSSSQSLRITESVLDYILWHTDTLLTLAAFVVLVERGGLLAEELVVERTSGDWLTFLILLMGAVAARGDAAVRLQSQGGRCKQHFT